MMATIEEQQDQIRAFQRRFRSMPLRPLDLTQKALPRNAAVRGPVWIAQDDIRVAGEDKIRDSVFEAIKSAAIEAIVLPPPAETPACDVHVEWVGSRQDTAQGAQLPDAEVFKKLQADTRHDVTAIFTHGGAFYSGNAVTSRAVTTKLARLTRGRVVCVDYRLAPRTQFPGQLIDLLLVYLALLYPPPGSKHAPVSASKIVLVGESSGGGLVLSLIQLILQLGRMQNSKEPRLHFGGREVLVPMPAGVAVHSAEVDKSLGLPSWTANGDIDFLQDIQPAHEQSQPPDDIWPSKPARHDVYCHSSAYLHPISNPCIASSWKGSPPLWFAYGQERCLDGGKLVASMAANEGVPVQFSEYSGMPHIFAITLSKFKQSELCMAEWAAACCAMAGGKKHDACAKKVWSKMDPADSSTQLDIMSLPNFSREEAVKMIAAATKARRLWVGGSKLRPSL